LNGPLTFNKSFGILIVQP